MASSRIYLSGAAKRKQRQSRHQNEAKSRRTLEGLNWYTKIQRNNKSRSEGVACEDDTTDMDNTTHTTINNNNNLYLCPFFNNLHQIQKVLIIFPDTCFQQ